MLYKQTTQCQAMVLDTRKTKELQDSKDLGKQDEIFLPIYFGVSCGLAFYNLLGCHKKMKQLHICLPMKGDSETVQCILKGASQLLGLLVWKAQKGSEDWQIEKKLMCNKLARAETEVMEMKKQRAEDAKANEKVVAMFAAQEQSWKAERRNLKQQLDVLLKDFQGLQARAKIGHESNCSECDLKEQRISELNAKIGEKDFLMMTTMETLDIQHSEKAEFQENLAASERLCYELKQKLTQEKEEREAEFRRHKAAFIDFVSNQRQMKIELTQALRQLESTRRESEIIVNEKDDAEVDIQNLSLQVAILEKESQDKEEVISDLLKKYHAESTEKEEFEQELKISRAMRRQAELEAERWRRECDGKIQSNRKQRWKLRNYSASRSDVYAELKSLHAEEIKNLHVKYGSQITFLQDKIQRYEEKLTELENNIMKHMGQKEKNCKANYKNNHVRDLVEIKDLLDSSDFDPEQYRSPDFRKTPPSQQEKEMDGISRVRKWSKLRSSGKTGARGLLKHYEECIRPEKTKHRAKLDQKHWQGLNSTSSSTSLEDESMESVNRYMLNMARDTKRLLTQVTILNNNLKKVKEENKVLEAMLIDRNQDINMLKARLNLLESKPILQKYQTALQIGQDERDVETMNAALRVVKKKLKEREREHRKMLMKVLEEVENELQEKDYKLAIVEAKLLQTQLQYQQERKAKEKMTSEIDNRKSRWKGYFLDDSLEFQEDYHISGFFSSCLEEEELCNMASKAKDNILQMEDNHQKHLRDLVSKATEVSRAGCHIRTLKSLIRSAEEKIEISSNPNVERANARDKKDGGENFALDNRELSSRVFRHGNISNSLENNKDGNKKNRREATNTDKCKHEKETNLSRVQSEVSMKGGKGVMKGKVVNSFKMSAKSKEELPTDGIQERQVQKQSLEEGIPSTKSFETALQNNDNVKASANLSSSETIVVSSNFSWKEDVINLATSLNIEEVCQQLEQLEKTSKAHDLDFLATPIRNGQKDCDYAQSQLTWEPVSAVDLLKKQVKRYQSLIAKLKDLCKRVQQDSESVQCMDSLCKDTEQETETKELLLIETLQLQKYVVATGQKLNIIQPEISYGFDDIDEDIVPQVVLDIGQSVEIAICHLKDIQKKLEAWIDKIIVDLDGQLANYGVLHVMPSQGKKKIKLRCRKNKVSSRSQRWE